MKTCSKNLEWNIEYCPTEYRLKINNTNSSVNMQIEINFLEPEDLKNLAVMFRKAYQEATKKYLGPIA